VESNSHLLWFCIVISLEKLNTQLFLQVRSKIMESQLTSTYTCILWSFYWLIWLSMHVCYDRPEWLCKFWWYDTQLNWKFLCVLIFQVPWSRECSHSYEVLFLSGLQWWCLLTKLSIFHLIFDDSELPSTILCSLFTVSILLQEQKPV